MREHVCVFLTMTHVIVSLRPDRPRRLRDSNTIYAPQRRYWAQPLHRPIYPTGMRTVSPWPRRTRELP